MSDTITGSRAQSRAAFDQAYRLYGSKQYCYKAPTNYPYMGMLDYYWCAAFVVFQLVAAGLDLRKVITQWAYCPAVEAYMWASVDWITTPVTSARDGDIVLFKRNGSAYHIGIVDGDYQPATQILPTREGDTSNSLVRETGVGGCYARKTRYVPNYTTGGYTLHIFRHVYAGDTAATTSKPTTPSAPASTGTVTVLQVGSTGTTVAHLQAGLTKVFPAYCPKGGLVPDGVYGPLTKAAVIKFQTACHIAADGVVGATTLAYLAKYGVKI